MASIDLRRLQMFHAVVETGSLSAAADVLAFTASAVSQQMAKLEVEVGVPLLQRHARGVHPTEAGRVLAHHARRLDELTAAAQVDMQAFAGLRRGTLTIATFPTAGATILPRAISSMRRSHPGLELSVWSARRAELTARLRRHESEVALLWEFGWDPIDDPEIHTVTIARDPTVVLLPAGHALAGRSTVDLAALVDEDWIVRAEHPVGSVLQRVCAEAGFAPRVVLSANDYQEVQGLVGAGLGVSLAPLLAVLSPRDDVEVCWLAGNPAERRILLACATDTILSPGAAVAWDVLADSAARLLDARR